MVDKADKIERSDTPLTSAQGIQARFQLGYAQSATNTFELDVDINIRS